MDITCKRCRQKYHIPDEQLTDRRLHFNCEKCDYQIIIDKRGESWLLFKGLSGKTLSSSDIVEGVYFSFNMKNILMTFSFLLTYSIILIIISLVVSRNVRYFLEHPVFFTTICFILFTVLTFGYDLHLYMLSKNVYHRIYNGSNLQFSSIASEIFNDLKPVFFLSIGLMILFGIIFFPIYLMHGTSGIIYEGIFHIVFFILISLIVFIQLHKSIIYSYIAFRSRSFKSTFENILRFIEVENLNIPVYLFYAGTLTSVIFLILNAVLCIAMIIIALFLIPGIGADSGISFGHLISSASSGMINFIKGAGAKLLKPMSDGFVLIGISSYVVFIFLMAYIINLNQTLCSVSIYIMESNPGRSVNRRALVLAVTLIFIALIIISLLLFR